MFQAKKGPMLDFDEEAKALWERLNLDPASRKNGQWNPIDSIWRWWKHFKQFLSVNIKLTNLLLLSILSIYFFSIRHPVGGGTIYVGNQTAAENIALLRYKNFLYFSILEFTDTSLCKK